MLTAKKPGSAPCPMLVTKYGTMYLHTYLYLGCLLGMLTISRGRESQQRWMGLKQWLIGWNGDGDSVALHRVGQKPTGWPWDQIVSIKEPDNNEVSALSLTPHSTHNGSFRKEISLCQQLTDQRKYNSYVSLKVEQSSD